MIRFIIYLNQNSSIAYATDKSLVVTLQRDLSDSYYTLSVFGMDKEYSFLRWKEIRFNVGDKIKLSRSFHNEF